MTEALALFITIYLDYYFSYYEPVEYNPLTMTVIFYFTEGQVSILPLSCCSAILSLWRFHAHSSSYSRFLGSLPGTPIDFLISSHGKNVLARTFLSLFFKHPQ